jgi:hypothetical protein
MIDCAEALTMDTDKHKMSMLRKERLMLIAVIILKPFPLKKFSLGFRGKQGVWGKDEAQMYGNPLNMLSGQARVSRASKCD